MNPGDVLLESTSATIKQFNRLLATLRFCDQTKTLELSSVAVAPLLFRVRHENVEAARQRGIEIESVRPAHGYVV